MKSVKVMPEKGKLSKDFLKRLLRSEFRMYYTTPELNDILYLHYKGLDKIENLEEFTGLKVLYIEGNGLKEICGLEACINLRCLYIQENLVKRIENLSTLTNLVNLNLSDNCIQKIENLAPLTSLTTLLLKRNQLGRGGLPDLEGLVECQSLTCIDVQENHIEEETFPQQILARMAGLAVLYMQNNPFTKKISHYRKSIINIIPELKYLDDKPVFDDERRFAFAWKRGGLEQERLERQKYKKEQEEAHLRNHLAFKEMMDKAKAEREARERRQQESSSETNSESNPTSLETYNSPDASEQVSRGSQHVDSDQQPSCSEPSEHSCADKEPSVRSSRSRQSKASERSLQIFQVPGQPQPQDPSIPELETVPRKSDVDFEELD